MHRKWKRDYLLPNTSFCSLVTRAYKYGLNSRKMLNSLKCRQKKFGLLSSHVWEIYFRLIKDLSSKIFMNMLLTLLGCAKVLLGRNYWDNFNRNRNCNWTFQTTIMLIWIIWDHIEIYMKILNLWFTLTFRY